VEDDGPGIPADKREIVLGRRVRLDEARKFPGSGLGLSLVAAVTKLHERAWCSRRGAGPEGVAEVFETAVFRKRQILDGCFDAAN